LYLSPGRFTASGAEGFHGSEILQVLGGGQHAVQGSGLVPWILAAESRLAGMVLNT
jgi:hypothetical protein